VHFNTLLIHKNVELPQIENYINIRMSWSCLVGQVELMIKFPFEIRCMAYKAIVLENNMATEYANYTLQLIYET
jgi:hypothetical protein